MERGKYHIFMAREKARVVMVLAVRLGIYYPDLKGRVSMIILIVETSLHQKLYSFAWKIILL